MNRRRCRNRTHVHYCRRHDRYHHHHHHHHSHHSHKHHHQHFPPGYPHSKPFGQRSVISKVEMSPADGGGSGAWDKEIKDRGLVGCALTAWEDNSPDSLLDIATRFVLKNPQTYCRQIRESSSTSPKLSLLPDLYLPTEICEKLFSTLQEEGLDVTDDIASIFADTETTRLRAVSVRGSSISDVGLGHLVRHKLRELDVHNCENITPESLELINQYSDLLMSINIGNSVHILPDYIYTKFDIDVLKASTEDKDTLEEELQRGIYDERGYILRAPILQRLCARDLFITRGPQYLDLLLKPLPNLTHLDLSGLVHNEDLGRFSFLLHLPMLVSLVLHNVGGIDKAVDNISKIKSLKHLDISHSTEKASNFDEPNTTLSNLIACLPNLISLDISGTNLAGTGAFGKSATNLDMTSCDIPGLSGRVNSPFEFLGLYKTSHEAACRAHIPAIKIAGDFNETQILVSGMQYLDRPAVLENVLNDLFHIFRYENCKNLRGALDVILLAMDRHPGEKVIQISGSASLYYVVKSEIRHSINIKMKRKILSTLLNGMFAHKNDPVMMRNGCLTLCQFSIPNDVIFDYERLIKILLFIVSEHTAEENSFVQRAGIFLLNSLACQVNGQQKLLVGNLGAMERMLALIRERVQTGNYDDVMETAWSCMWNVTDETPINCKRFLDGGGMQLFLRCKEEFPDRQDLLRNMMGLLGNVAEVESLRPALMTKEFVSEFQHLLDSDSDGIEVSYNAAGVLAHLASDGAAAWTIATPSRESVLERMVTAIESWDLETKRNINYRSFEPILRLVKVHHTPQCQHWAVWALANLTKVDGKYCDLIESEGGVCLLEELINSNTPSVPYQRVLELAQLVRENVNINRENKRKIEVDIDTNSTEDLEYDG